MILSSETSVSGNILCCIKGVKYHFEFQEGTWDFSGDAKQERASSPEDGGTPWNFSSCGGILEL